MTHWIDNAVFYHIYPLGLCGAPRHNDGSSAPASRLDSLAPWLEHAAWLGCNALYLGPLFESVSHGYATTDYFKVDRRLGDRASLKRLVEKAHGLGLRVILDGVFNHVGRDFFAFRDVLANRQNSAYTHWFSGLDFAADNSYHDRLSYHCWDGHQNLVKLNLANADVRGHLFDAVQYWMGEFDIDGLRLDAADVIDKGFLSELAGFTKSRNPDFWLMGEVVHGDYRDWAAPNRLDSVTNYECFKGLYSSFNDRNLFEIAWSLNRQFAEGGLYRHLTLYNFADNHDVSRVASLLKDTANLLPSTPSFFPCPASRRFITAASSRSKATSSKAMRCCGRPYRWMIRSKNFCLIR
jgi:glycosidase